MLSVFMMQTLQKRNIKATAVALEAAWITGFNEKTVWYYSEEFIENKGKLLRSRNVASTRGFASSMMRICNCLLPCGEGEGCSGPSMRVRAFYQWVNGSLLPFSNLPLFFPPSITFITATRWLHRLGYRPKSHKKGTYVNGHERQDGIDYCSKYRILSNSMTHITFITSKVIK